MFSDLVPIAPLREGFWFEGQRVSFGSFYKGIHRSRVQKGPAALTLLTAAPKPGQPAPYGDLVDPDRRSIIYHYRAGARDQPDNRSLRAAFELQAPVIYFFGVSPGQFQVIAPVFVVDDDPRAGLVLLEVGLPHQDIRGHGIVSSVEARQEQFAIVRRRLDQARFRHEVMRAYRQRCAVCALREPQLVEAAHITRYSDPAAIAGVVNGIALCAIHHLAYDRNLMGIDPAGVVHIGERLLRDSDGPMLSAGLQSFHGAAMTMPRRVDDQPDRDRLAQRYEEFLAS